MFKGLANIASLVKQAQQMGSKLQGINEELKAKRASGSAGGGLVEVEVNGLGEVLRVRIDPKLVEQQDREMIEDLIPAATNQAIAKSRQLHADAVKSMTSGMDIPGLGEALEGLQPGAGEEK
ncbi:MAG: YbaB/EbfC family nucleoid-associated protein [Pirellulales bacterium]